MDVAKKLKIEIDEESLHGALYDIKITRGIMKKIDQINIEGDLRCRSLK